MKPFSVSGADSRGRRVALALAVLFAASLVFASGALAARGIVGHFGEAGSGDGQISFGGGVDVNASSGDVYVTDAMNNRIERFDAGGNFELAFGWGVDDGSEEFQVCIGGCQAGNPGSGAGQFAGPYQGPRALAVDQFDGAVYVLDPGNARIEKFDKGGNFLRAFGWGVLDGSSELQACTTTCQAGVGGPGAGQIEGLWEGGMAVDPTSGNLLVADYIHTRVQEYDSAGAFVRMFGGDVEEGGGEGFEICDEAAKCKPGVEGQEPGMFGAYQPRRIAVDSDGTIYVTDGLHGNVQELTPSGGTLVPSVFASVENAVNLTVDRSTHHVVVVYQDPSSNYNQSAVELDGSGTVVDHYLGGLRYFSLPGIAFNEATGRGYVLAKQNFVFVLDELAKPEVTVEAATEITTTTATLNGIVNSQGEPATTYRFEYTLDGSGEWIPTTTGTVPGDLSDHHVSAQVSPNAGLEPNSTYRFRLVAEKPDNEEVVSAEETFTTSAAPPLVETVGSPFRTASTARLDSRVNPRGSATTYRFEWGPTASYGSVAPAGGEGEAGSGLRSVLVSEQLTGLQPGTTYHYRVVATNASGTTTGEDMTVTTRASDQPLTHGHFPGPPGSDRAYEQVNLDDTGGNPVYAGYAFSDDGNRAVYQVTGGTPKSDNGTLMNQFYAERTPNGWETSSIWPTRANSTGSIWYQPAGNRDLTRVMAQNVFPGASEWILTPGGAPQKLVEFSDAHFGSFYETNEEVTRVIVRMKGTVDPEYPMGDDQYQFYDVTSGAPHLISFMPDGSVPSCGVPMDGTSANLPNNYPRRVTHWISADGNRVFFPSAGDKPACIFEGNQLYMRNLEAEETVQISGPPVSGPECAPTLIKTNEESAFFWTQSRLDPADVEPAPGEANCTTWFPDGPYGDVYRYDFGDGAISCLTCQLGNRADVRTTSNGFGAGSVIAVAEDGSRIYFSSPRRLVEGEGTPGGQNVYRLDVESGDLKFVSPAGQVGDLSNYEKQAMTPNGEVIVFSSASPLMNGITGTDNHGLQQYYRYDDRDGSLICVSCPRDGTAPGEIGSILSEEQVGPNTTPISDAGDFVFVTSAPLLAADQNTVKPGEEPALGNDVYEWRDGRLLLITDGQTSWSGAFFNNVGVSGITPSGRDVYFTAPVQLTPDAIDGFKRLYDARIGGGFEFPQPEPPCPLEICQGEAKGAPNDPLPASDGFSGNGNVKPATKARRHKKCHRGRKKRCTKKHPTKHANKNGRAH